MAMEIMDLAILLRWLLLAAAPYFLTGYVLRLFLSHPHAPFPPGPKGWPIVGCLPLMGDMPHVSLTRLSKKYGHLMYLKIGSVNTVVASNNEVAKAFLKTYDEQFANRPITAGPNYIAYKAQDMVFAEYGPRWKLLRKLAKLHMLGPKALANADRMRHEEVGLMVRDICELTRQGKPVPFFEVVSCALSNIISQSAVRQRLFASYGEESTDFEEMVTELMRLAGLFNIGDFIPSLEWMDLQGIQGKMKKLHDKFDKLITKMLQEHKATTAERKHNPDLFDVVMATNLDNERVELKMVHFKALLLNLFIAGTDTSTATTEWTMTEILRNPRILKRAQEEIDQVVGKNRRLEESDLPKLLYLQAICKESFRRHPVVPLNLPRVNRQACVVNGYYIPKDTTLLTNIYAIGRDPTVWEDPLEFKPERFLGEKHSKVDPLGNSFELIPFGSGRRICAGARMGLSSVQYMTGTLVHCFDWKLPDGVKEIGLEESFGLVLGKAERLKALATPRLDPSVYKF